MVLHAGHSMPDCPCRHRLTYFKHGDVGGCRAAAVRWIELGLNAADAVEHQRCGALVPRSLVELSVVPAVHS